MQVVLEVVSRLVDFSHVADTFTAVSTEESSVMVQVKVTFVPLIVGCIVLIFTVGDGTATKAMDTISWIYIAIYGDIEMQPDICSQPLTQDLVMTHSVGNSITN